MYIKVVTTKIKVKGKRAKKVYRYVRVINREYVHEKGYYCEKVIAILGTLRDVRASARTLIAGLGRLPGE